MRILRAIGNFVFGWTIGFPFLILGLIAGLMVLIGEWLMDFVGKVMDKLQEWFT